MKARSLLPLATAASVLLASSFLLLAGCGGEDASALGARRPEPPRLLLLVTLDTLRADHLPCYGYPRAAAPFLGELAERSTVFDHAVSAMSYTLPSHTSMLTGVYPPRHGVLTNLQTLESDLPSLPALLREAGYHTVAFTAVRFLKGLAGEFDEFHAMASRTDPTQVYRPADEMAEEVVRWWREEGSRHEKVFLWVHLFDVHEHGKVKEIDPRIASEPPDERRRWLAYLERRIGRPLRPTDPIVARIDAYDTLLLRMDGAVRRLFSDVAASDTFYVVVADHGEGLGNHGFLGHARYIWQEQVRVPLIAGYTDVPPARPRHGGVVRTIDLFPTFLEAAGLDAPALTPAPVGHEALDARSLLPLVLDTDVAEPPRLAFSMRRPADERMVRDNGWRAIDMYALQDERYKLLRHSDGVDHLYDLVEDPREEHDLLADGEAPPPAFRRVVERFGKAIERVLAARGAEGAVDESRIRELRELGYLK